MWTSRQTHNQPGDGPRCAERWVVAEKGKSDQEQNNTQRFLASANVGPRSTWGAGLLQEFYHEVTQRRTTFHCTPTLPLPVLLKHPFSTALYEFAWLTPHILSIAWEYFPHHTGAEMQIQHIKIGWEKKKKWCFISSLQKFIDILSQPSSFFFFFLSGLRGFWLSQDMTPDSFKNRKWKQYGCNDLIALHTAHNNLIHYWWCSH